MGRKTITVPATGVSKAFSITGKSILILSGGSYNRLTDFPKISFNDPGEDLPGVPRSTFQYSEQGCFDRVAVTGTAASAGDELILLTTNSCLGSQVNTNIAETAKSLVGTTQVKQANNDVQGFSEIELMNSDEDLPKKIYIWVVGGSTRGVNYAYNSDPSQDFQATDSAYWDNDPDHNPAELLQLEIEGINWILAFNFIATVADETPTLVWTPEY